MVMGSDYKIGSVCSGYGLSLGCWWWALPNLSVVGIGVSCRTINNVRIDNGLDKKLLLGQGIFNQRGTNRIKFSNL